MPTWICLVYLCISRPKNLRSLEIWLKRIHLWITSLNSQFRDPVRMFTPINLVLKRELSKSSCFALPSSCILISTKFCLIRVLGIQTNHTCPQYTPYLSELQRFKGTVAIRVLSPYFEFCGVLSHVLFKDGILGDLPLQKHALCPLCPQNSLLIDL